MAIFKCKTCGANLNVKEGMTVCECEYCNTVQELPKVIGFNRADTEPLLERAFVFLANCEWENADSYCERALDIDSKCAKAYLGKLLAELKLENEESLSQCNEKFYVFNNYKKLYKYSNQSYKYILDGYRNENIYRHAENSYNHKNYQSALELYNLIPNYKNSSAKISMAKEKYIESLYQSGINFFNSGHYFESKSVFQKISNYKDSQNYVEMCTELLENQHRDNVLSMGVGLMDSGNFNDLKNAIDIFDSIPNYKNSNELKIQCIKLMISDIKELINSDDKININKALKRLESVQNISDFEPLFEECTMKINKIQKKEKIRQFISSLIILIIIILMIALKYIDFNTNP